MNSQKILFASPPLRGHATRLIALADEMVARGHDVSFAIAPDVGQWLAGTDVQHVPWNPVTPIDEDFRQDFAAATGAAIGERNVWRGRWHMFDCSLRWYPRLLPTMRQIIRDQQPDLLVVDHASAPAIDAAHEAGIPFVVLSGVLGHVMSAARGAPHFSTSFPAAMNWHQRTVNRALPYWLRLNSRGMHKRFVQVRAACGIRSSFHEPFRDNLTIVTSCFGLELPRALPPRMHLTGPVFPRRPERIEANLAQWLDEADQGVIYVSFGTLTALDTRQLTALADALSRTAARVLWSLPSADQASLPSLANNIRIEPYVAQRAVLAHRAVKLAMIHGGSNSIQEALWEGVPLLVMPFFGDQHYNAARIADVGCGLRVDCTAMNDRNVADKISQLTTRTQFRASAERLSTVLQKSGGRQQAADLLEMVTLAGTEHLVA